MAIQKIWPSPAKINLFLHIVGKRPDGYHELQTVFQFLDYGDDLFFDLRDDGVIAREYDLGFSEESDLCLRAASLLKPLAGESCGVSIGLTKRLPMGGGLGGGSSNAATTLIALNELWNIGLTLEALAELGLELGADVPVFVMGRSAWAEGVGEVLTPVDLAEKWYLVLNPEINVPTEQIFSNKRLTRGSLMKRIRPLEKGIDSTFGENQLEQIVRAEFPEVNAIFEWLSQYGKARMSGSGGSVFVPVKSQEYGLSLLAQKPLSTSGFVARGMNIHPLLMS